MSVLGKRWIIKNKDKELSTFEKLLQNREHIDIEENQELHDPFLFSDMEKAVIRILEAVRKKERIIIFGDYDVDGISSTAILGHTLRILKANVSFRLPNRVADGYGLSEKFIDEFIEKEIKLVITVDCGISCKNEIQKAKDNGIDTVITDHHTIPKEPPSSAYAILHPKYENSYPYQELTGAGVALKLAQALLQRTKNDSPETIDSLLDLALLGTIADLGPLTGENRQIVKRGLQNIPQTKLPGLKKLFETSKSTENIDAATIGFRIAPRINAAGRIGDPYLPLKLLLEEEEGEITTARANELQSINVERQNITEESLEEAELKFDKENLPPILIAHSADWHVGILGLIAGRLAEKYGRPAIILQDLGETLTASARSLDYFNIIEAITASKEYLINFGGHAQAAGLSIKKENLEDFKKFITQYAESALKGKDLSPILNIDCEISEEEISFKLLEQMRVLAPFGIGNQLPRFLLKEVTPHFIEQVGQNKNHLKFSVNINNQSLRVIAFNMGEYAEQLKDKEKIDIVFNLEKNTWNNKDYIQVRALDFRI